MNHLLSDVSDEVIEKIDITNDQITFNLKEDKTFTIKVTAEQIEQLLLALKLYSGELAWT